MGVKFTTESVSDWLVEAGLMSPEQRETALGQDKKVRREILAEKVRKGRARNVHYEVSPAEVIAFLNFRIPRGRDRRLEEEQITQVIAEKSGYIYEKLDPLKLDVDLIINTLSRPFARRHAVLPINRQGNQITVSVANPFDLELIENIRRITGCEVKVVVSSKRDILKSITEIYGFRRSVTAAAEQFENRTSNYSDAVFRDDLERDQFALDNLEQYVKLKDVDELESTDKHVINTVEYLLHYAFDQRASDIHFEPKRDHSQIRLRIDGILHHIYRLPKRVHTAVISRIKTMARMDIAEKRQAQDGRIKTERGDREIELRVSTIPIAFGEKLVIRIFDPQAIILSLSTIGFFEIEQRLYESFMTRNHGLLLVTGPTGSGKTTTLYSTLRVLATEEVNVMTIEDPIEMVYEEFNQIAIKPKIGITYASVLRSILRQDPDIIMVGEIRDLETAEIAIQAALTGHLVLSTLHTNDTATTIARLVDLGIEPYLVSSTLIGCVSQRLVRTICEDCAAETRLSDEEIAVLGIQIPEGESRNLSIRGGTGCQRCRGTGLYGRTGIFEVMEINDNIRRLINESADAPTIMHSARQGGMMTVREAAIRKLALGETTFEEVVRVTSD